MNNTSLIEHHLQDGSKRGHIGQLQSQVQRTDFNEVETDFNIPESWKWENQTNVKDRKERKGKNKNKKTKNKKTKQSNEITNE